MVINLMKYVKIPNRQVKKPSLSTPNPIPPTKSALYYQSPPQLEAETRPNLEKKLSELVPNGAEISVTARSLPFNLSLRINFV
jgi:ubiquitin-activating enzyme E1 C